MVLVIRWVSSFSSSTGNVLESTLSRKEISSYIFWRMISKSVLACQVKANKGVNEAMSVKVVKQTTYIQE